MNREKNIAEKIWNVLFAVIYPVLALFSLLFTSVLSVLSFLSKSLADLLKPKSAKKQ